MKPASVANKKEEEKKVDIVEHLKGFDEMSSLYNVKFNPQKPPTSPGLTSEEAKRRLETDGLNQLSPPKKVHPFIQFCMYMLGLFNVMLWVAGIVAYIIYAVDPVDNASNVYIGGICIVVAFLNAFIEFYQTQKSQAILESFLTINIPAVELVKGDVVYIRSGDKIPADLFIFAATDAKVDNASLTGEAEAQERGVVNSQTNPLEAHNLMFNGTLCVNGECYGIVIRTGDNTVIGQIAFLTSTEERRESPMNQEIHFFVYTIAAVAGVTALTFLFVARYARNNTWAYAFNFAIGTFVGFVPEGLPATVTILLSLAAKKMANRNVLVKDLQGVETLGAITLLATDKTGTLTRNQMTVTYIWSGNRLFFAIAQSGIDSSAVEIDLHYPPLNEVIHISALCSKARFETNDGPIATRPVLGDATEAGLLRNAAQKLDRFATLHDDFPKVFEIPFNSDNKWAMTIHRKSHSNGHFMLYLKGAPERVLKLCSTFHDGTNAVPLTEAHTSKFDETYNFMASKGHRVLAFACYALPGDKYPSDYEFKKDPANYPKDNLTFYGLISLEDPPKHGVREAIGHCREAGIKVMMVTGDHPLTAESIGRKINLMLQDTKETLAKKRKCRPEDIPEADAHAIVIHGEKIDGLTEADWDNIFSKEEIIFARTSPKHKLTIVKHAQSLGHIVGVTGDGVNDSPALKKADLGIAMNISGSDVSKEAAAMILIDDNFASCVNGIEEGRLIFQNLKKSVKYTITHTMPEVFANLLNVAVPIPLPLNAILIMVVDLGFELFLALSFAWDIPEDRNGLMKLQPRRPVTPASIARTKSDAKNGVPPLFQRIKRNWYEPIDEETLVDSGVLSYAYIEVGTLETIGCLVAFFFAMWYHSGITPTDSTDPNFGSSGYTLVSSVTGKSFSPEVQLDAIAYGNSAYYLCLMIQQAFNLFCVKAKFNYPIGKFMFSNFRNFAGIFLGAALVMMIVYIPPFNIAFGTEDKLTPLTWLIGLGSGVMIFVYVCVRLAILRSRNIIKFSQEVKGLDLHPTKFSYVGLK
ncbi:hypothetical protein HK103_004570 [Boothiomyces macroporosus]|uniref:Cation-transporting P-type ATPase N-terminal domain-containing protein n=1 Tax=Boothiomyces macroporosus TaxID=261099 RepID=A0AAD5UGD3_9FUNG|nr:hypothetical protein HK103_004570 [Boothiomyces macroporosus]